MTPHVLGQVRPDALVTRAADEPERHLRTGRAVTPCHTSETTGPAPNDSRRAFRTIANDIEPALDDACRRDIPVFHSQCEDPRSPVRRFVGSEAGPGADSRDIPTPCVGVFVRKCRPRVRTFMDRSDLIGALIT
jgi:hypothetical protein